MTAVADLLSLIAGALLGYFARDIRDKLTKLYEFFEERIEAPGGVVRTPPRSVPTKGRVIPEDSDTGPVSRPSPYAAEINRQEDKAEKERRMYNA